MAMPTHAVVDTRDGAIRVRGHDGKMFTGATATAYAATLNRNREHPPYIVMELIKRSTRKDSGT